MESGRREKLTWKGVVLWRPKSKGNEPQIRHPPWAVPQFISNGDVVRVDTAQKKYVGKETG